jgi:Protein of unknown function (DUF2939)
MIWWLRAAAGLALAWIVYAASPFVALHSLGRAVEDGDTAAIRRRVNFRGLRVSLMKQIVGTYVDEVGGGKLSPGDRQLAVQAGMQVAQPLVESILSPEFIIDLLDDGWPQAIVAPRAETPAEARPDASPSPAAQADEAHDEPPAVRIGQLLRVSSLGSARQVYAQSELHGFRAIIIALPADRPLADRFRLRLRLTGSTWKLVALEIPDNVLMRLLRRLPERWAPRRDEAAQNRPAAPAQ